jgi:hypothetical protein
MPIGSGHPNRLMSGRLVPSGLGHRRWLWRHYVLPLAQEIGELQQAGAHLLPFTIGETASREGFQGGSRGSF